MLTYPYLSRILGPERLGAVHFMEYSVGLLYSIASVGVPAYGVYRIAQLETLGRRKRDTYIHLTLLHVFLSILGFGIFYWLVREKTDWRYIQTILPIGLIHILANSAAADWYIQGKERFDFSSLRNFLIRLIGLIAIFWTIRDAADYEIYYWIILMSIGLTAIINTIWIRLDLRDDRIKEKAETTFQYRELMIFFMSSVLISCTDFLDVTMLGLLSNEEQIGYYSNAAKLIRLSLLIPMALNIVVTPQFSSAYASGNDRRPNEILNSSMQWLIYLAVPISILYLLYAKEVIFLIAGAQFEGSIEPMRWMAGIPLLVSLSNLLLYFGLSGTDKKMKTRIVFGVLTGMLLSGLLNYLLIPLMGAVGAAINSLIIECGFVILFANTLSVRIKWAELFKSLASCSIFIPIYWASSIIEGNLLIKLISVATCSVAGYVLIQKTVWKHSSLTELIRPRR
jgi:O-antigen/teichoic acid export membrane protein